MNGLANLGWALLSLLGAACFLTIGIADHTEIGRRLRQGAHLLASAGPCFVAAVLTWACRGRSPSPAHPAARAAVDEEFAALERQYWDVPAVADSDRLTPRGEG